VFCVFQVLSFGFPKNKSVGRSFSVFPSPTLPLTKAELQVSAVWFVAPSSPQFKYFTQYHQGYSISVTPSSSQYHSGIISLYIMGSGPKFKIFLGTHLYKAVLRRCAAHYPCFHQESCSKFHYIVLYYHNNLMIFSQLTIAFTVCSHT
jgi:hypothetical protein